MAVKIIDANIKTKYSWQDICNQGSWSTVKNTNFNWGQLLQTSAVGQLIEIEVEIVESNWDGIKKVFANWQKIKDSFANWLGIKNW